MIRVVYYLVKGICFIPFLILFHPTIVGRENIPKEGGVVIAGNHTKWLDPVLVVFAVSRCVHFLAKIELFKGLGGLFFKSYGCIPVNRKVHDKSVLENAKEVLKKGEVIGIFPEGTINRTDKTILPFKIGAVKMAQETDTKVVPFVITGKYKVFGRGIKIEFLEGMKIGSDLTYANEKLMKKVATYLEVNNGNN